MAEDIVGHLQEIGVRGYHADLAAFLAGIQFHSLLELPAVIEPGHGVLLRQGLQGALLLLMEALFTLQGADGISKAEIVTA